MQHGIRYLIGQYGAPALESKVICTGRHPVTGYADDIKSAELAYYALEQQAVGDGVEGIKCLTVLGYHRVGYEDKAILQRYECVGELRLNICEMLNYGGLGWLGGAGYYGSGVGGPLAYGPLIDNRGDLLVYFSLHHLAGFLEHHLLGVVALIDGDGKALVLSDGATLCEVAHLGRGAVAVGSSRPVVVVQRDGHGGHYLDALHAVPVILVRGLTLNEGGVGVQHRHFVRVLVKEIYICHF